MSKQKDQATELRWLIDQSKTEGARVNPARLTTSVTGPSPVRSAHTLAITSGKGGVGKTLIALNLAIALSQRGQKVCLLDGDLGLSNLDLLCGIPARGNLSHLLAETKDLSEIILDGPAGIDLIAGAAGLAEIANLTTTQQKNLTKQLSQLDTQYDFILLDCSSGIQRASLQLASLADRILLTSTLETTSLADTYTAIKVYQREKLPDVQVLFNRAEPAQAQQAMINLKKTTQQFLNLDLSILGCLPEEPLFQQSVARRKPFQTEYASTPVGRLLTRLADQFIRHKQISPLPRSLPFVQQLITSQLSAA